MSASKRTHILNEIVTSEGKYVDFLSEIRAHRTALLKRKLIPVADVKLLFANIEQIAPMHDHLLVALETELRVSKLFGRVFMKVAPFLNLYKAYVDNYDVAVKRLATLQQSKRKFAAYLDKATRESPLGLTLGSLLVMPVQRVPRYRLLLQVAVKSTPPEHDDYYKLVAALRLVSKAADAINDSVDLQHSRCQLWAAQKRTELSLFLPTRSYIDHGTLLELGTADDGDISIDLYLFSDAILLVPSAPKGHVGYKFLPLHMCKVVLVGEEFAPNAFKIVSGSLVHIFQAPTKAEAMRWASDIVACICVIKGLPLHVEPYQALYARRSRITKQPDLPEGWWCLSTGRAMDDVCFWETGTGLVTRMHPESYGDLEPPSLEGMVVETDTTMPPSMEDLGDLNAVVLNAPLAASGSGSAAAPADDVSEGGEEDEGEEEAVEEMPAGWIRAMEDGDVFFYNSSTGESRWEPPEASSSALPQGWSAVEDGEDTYYYNSVSGESQWEVPTAATPTSAPPPAEEDAAATQRADEEAASELSGLVASALAGEDGESSDDEYRVPPPKGLGAGADIAMSKWIGRGRSHVDRHTAMPVSLSVLAPRPSPTSKDGERAAADRKARSARVARMSPLSRSNTAPTRRGSAAGAARRGSSSLDLGKQGARLFKAALSGKLTR